MDGIPKASAQKELNALKYTEESSVARNSPITMTFKPPPPPPPPI